MNPGSPALVYHYLEMVAHLKRACYVPDSNFPWPLGEVSTPVLQMKKLRLQEVIVYAPILGKWLSGDLNPYMSQVLSVRGCAGGLLESKGWGISREGRMTQGAQPSHLPQTVGWRQWEVGLRGPICRHSGLGGDSTFYLCREFKSLLPPQAVGSLMPILGGRPMTGQMGNTSFPLL